MSFKVVDLVLTRKVGKGPETGSGTRKGVLVAMAKRAGDDGRGVFCSKESLAEMAEVSERAAYRACVEFENEGLIVRRGKRGCKRGATIIYDLNLTAIKALPDLSSDVNEVPSSDIKPCQSGSLSNGKPCQSGSVSTPYPDTVAGHTLTQWQTKQSMKLSPDDDDAGARESENYPIGGKVHQPPMADVQKSWKGVGPDLDASPDHLQRLCVAMGRPNHRPDAEQVAEVMRWSGQLGLTPSEQEAVIADVVARKRGDPPRSLRYFIGSMNEASDSKFQPTGQTGSPNPKSGVSADDFEQCDQLQPNFEIIPPSQRQPGFAARPDRSGQKPSLVAAYARLKAAHPN